MTAEPAAFDQVRGKLEERAVAGEAVTEAELREEFGIGHDDLTQVLQSLSNDGEAVHEAPGEWRAPYADERERFARATGEEGDGEAAEPEAAAAEAVERTAAGGLRRQAPVRPQVVAGDGEVVLTKGVLSVMDDETIGKIVKAGVEESDGDEFVLRVAL
jgi:hypothetical protein